MARATVIGFTAVIMWAMLALLTDSSGDTPPFLLSALTFTVGAAAGFVFLLLSPRRERTDPVPLAAWLVGIGGLFGYHFFYFTALRNAPAAQASLICNLWPLLIVLGSALMPGEKLRWNHVAGALLGLGGTALIVTGGQGFGFDSQFGYGYAMAGACALIWSSYSLLSRRFAAVPTTMVAWFCLATAILSMFCHLLLEETIWPASPAEWLAVGALGLLPVGAAFYAWDHGVKHGNIQLLGAASYAAPLLSILLLIAAGRASMTASLLAACLLITGGAGLAAKRRGRS